MSKWTSSTKGFRLEKCVTGVTVKNVNVLVPALSTFIPLWKVQTNSKSSSQFSFGIHFLNPLNILVRWRQHILKYGAFSIPTSKISLDWLSRKFTRLRAAKSQNAMLPLTWARVLRRRKWLEWGMLEIWHEHQHVLVTSEYNGGRAGGCAVSCLSQRSQKLGR